MKRKLTRPSTLTKAEVQSTISNALAPIADRLDALEGAVFGTRRDPNGGLDQHLKSLEERLTSLQHDLQKRITALDKDLSQRINEVIEITAELRKLIAPTGNRLRAMQVGGDDVDTE